MRVPSCTVASALGLSSNSQRLSSAGGPNNYARQSFRRGQCPFKQRLGALLLGCLLEQLGQRKPAMLLDRKLPVQKAGTGIPLHAQRGHSWRPGLPDQSPCGPDRCKVRCITVSQPRRDSKGTHTQSLLSRSLSLSLSRTHARSLLRSYSFFSSYPTTTAASLVPMAYGSPMDGDAGIWSDACARVSCEPVGRRCDQETSKAGP
ncbi:hypothetical protein BD289DRAFT_422486 [Coniella lustricola]|uniref:Uncharacterized protein n=1 Tax=Coniella lustricola TaxID=2025994 RepID=A0A2T3AL35_9PEZI|nr:hypothetical protein BD289DRAFT_422486 [Coniella lustricola]